MVAGMCGAQERLCAAVWEERSVLGGRCSGGTFLWRRLCEGTSEEQSEGGFGGCSFVHEGMSRLCGFGMYPQHAL